MHICRPFYKIMDSRTYIMHANDLRVVICRPFYKIMDSRKAAPARLPRCTRPAVTRLLICRSLLLVRWCHIKFGDSISRSVRLDNTAGCAARRHRVMMRTYDTSTPAATHAPTTPDANASSRYTHSAPALQTCDDASYMNWPFLWYTFLNYCDDRQIFHRLHWTNQWLCVSRRTNMNQDS